MHFRAKTAKTRVKMHTIPKTSKNRYCNEFYLFLPKNSTTEAGGFPKWINLGPIIYLLFKK